VSTCTHLEEGATFVEAGCDAAQQVSHGNPGGGLEIGEFEEPGITIHQRTILSVTRSREMVYKETPSLNLMALSIVECEAVGALRSVPCLFIRGISDYADSHKNDN
jgi:hypothetical protein